jgi:hypothetical protein
MEVERGLVYPRQTMLDDDLVNTSSYVVVKVDMVHENSKDLKLEVSSDDTTLTSIDVDPSTAAAEDVIQGNTGQATIETADSYGVG